MGYGRINCLRALDFADVMIRDYQADGGLEPSSPPGGNFWTYSDIAIRIFDDDVFEPQDPTQSGFVERGQPNYLYIRVTNNGVREARNVGRRAHRPTWAAVVYPQDWCVDATHVSPTPIVASFASIPAGTSVIAKFSISSAQVEDLWGWIAGPELAPLFAGQHDGGQRLRFRDGRPRRRLVGGAPEQFGAAQPLGDQRARRRFGQRAHGRRQPLHRGSHARTLDRPHQDPEDREGAAQPR
jgi:hypothetical protein